MVQIHNAMPYIATTRKRSKSIREAHYVFKGAKGKEPEYLKLQVDDSVGIRVHIGSGYVNISPAHARP